METCAAKRPTRSHYKIDNQLLIPSIINIEGILTWLKNQRIVRNYSFTALRTMVPALVLMANR